jgi:acetyl esterase
MSSPALVARLARKRSAPRDGRTFDAEMAAILAVDDLDAGSDLRKLPLAEARAKLAEQIAIIDAEGPSDVATGRRSIKGLGGSISVLSYVPRFLSGPLPTVVYFHGGGFVLGSPETHDGFCRRIASGARCRVFSIDYRLAPESPYPAPIDDGLTALRWVFEEAEALGVDPKRVAVMGDSAGGNLSAVVALKTRQDRERPALQVLIYPATDARCGLASHRVMGEGFLLTSEMIDWYYQQYLGPDPAMRLLPDVSPLLEHDLTGAPPALVYTAGFDPLRDEGAAYAERLRQAAVFVHHQEQPSLPHGYALMTRGARAARKAVDEIVADVRAELWKGLRG